ncbi:MAG: MATE family efflux transporter [Ruminococcaceae bacterium]|nr:MATE family efflux transporter [Oscillospiraceae bacterium]
MKKIDMCNGPILKPMIKFAIPILLTGFLQQLFNAADVILAGRLGTSGSDAVAAVGSTTAITSLLITFFIGCSVGSAVTVSHALGSKNAKDIKETIHTAMFLSVILGAVLMILGLLFSEVILGAMGTPKDIIGKSTLYLKAYFTGMIPYMVYYFGAAILRATGETQKPLYFLMLSGPIKLVLTIVFVAVLKLDVVGLALATTASQFVSALLIIITLVKRKDESRLEWKSFKIYKKPLMKILRLGIPSGIQSATFSFSNVIIQTSVNSLSVLPGFITGNAAACNIVTFADILTGVFYQCSLNFVGQNVGAKKYDRVKKSTVTALAFSVISVAVFSTLVLIFSKQILGIYITDSNQAIKWGMVRLAFVFTPLIIQGVMDVMSGSIRGMGVSISSTIITLAGVCGVRILWCLTVFKIPQFHTPQVLFASYPISWVITVALQVWLFVFVYKKQNERLNNKVL